MASKERTIILGTTEFPSRKNTPTTSPRTFHKPGDVVETTADVTNNRNYVFKASEEF